MDTFQTMKMSMLKDGLFFTPSSPGDHMVPYDKEVVYAVSRDGWRAWRFEGSPAWGGIQVYPGLEFDLLLYVMRSTKRTEFFYAAMLW